MIGLLTAGGAVLYWASLEKNAATWPTVSSQAFVALMLLALLTMLLTSGLKFAPGLRFRPEWAILGLLAADIVLHAPRQNPAVIPHAYEPGIAKLHTSMPRLGEGRALITREMEIFMAHASNPDALNYCIGVRRALFANWNLLEGVPKANGFYSLFPRELAETWQLLYGFGHPFPEPFADFLAITRASSSNTLFAWEHRTNALRSSPPASNPSSPTRRTHCEPSPPPTSIPSKSSICPQPMPAISNRRLSQMKPRNGGCKPPARARAFSPRVGPPTASSAKSSPPRLRWSSSRRPSTIRGKPP